MELSSQEPRTDLKSKPTQSDSAAKRAPLWVAIPVLALAVTCYAAFIWSSGADHGGVTYFSLFDDAMISMTYARNLSEGAGLVWNAGGAPVEGYTNFLWTLWMALLHLLPVSEAKVSLLVMISGAATLLANLWVVERLCSSLSLSSTVSRVYALGATALCAPLMFWTLRGMEVGLLCLLVDSCLLLVIGSKGTVSPQRALGISLVLSLGVLSRADFAVTAGALSISAALAVEPGRRMRTLSMILLPVAGVWLAHAAFRMAYYGDVLPNTYYLKMTGLAATARIWRGLEVFMAHTLPYSGSAFALAAVGLLFRDYREHRGVRMLAPVIVAQVAYSIYVGGDAWEEFGIANRYVTVAIPGLALCGAVVLDLCQRRWSDPSRAALTALVVALLAYAPMNIPHFCAWIYSGIYYVNFDHQWTANGLVIRARTPEDITIAVSTAGAIPYFARRSAIDLLGKSDRVVAHLPHSTGAIFIPGHSKRDLEYSIGQLRPDLVVSRVGGGAAFYRNLGYVEAPHEIGRWMTRDLASRIERTSVQ